jgi:MYXO-CTERM domain-containing protein
MSRRFSSVAIAVLLGCVGTAYGQPATERLQSAIAAETTDPVSHPPTGRYEDDEVCAAGVTDRPACDAADQAAVAVAATDTSPAPNSQAYALMLAGLGAAGFLARRRQSL